MNKDPQPRNEIQYKVDHLKSTTNPLYLNKTNKTSIQPNYKNPNNRKDVQVSYNPKPMKTTKDQTPSAVIRDCGGSEAPTLSPQ